MAEEIKYIPPAEEEFITNPDPSAIPDPLDDSIISVDTVDQPLPLPFEDSPIILNEGSELSVSFGRREDKIELHIYDTSNNLLYSENNFTDYISDESIEGNLINSINIDPENILSARGYSFGEFNLKLNILRNKVLNSLNPEFLI